MANGEHLRGRLHCLLAMAYTAEQVTSMLDSSFQGDSSDDDLGFDAEELDNYIRTTDGKRLGKVKCSEHMNIHDNSNIV